MDCQEVCDRLDDLLETAAYADVDASANGLQVGEPTGELEHVAFAVDAAVETIEMAQDVDADLLVVHHGLSWGGIDRITGIEYQRIAGLIEAELPLYVSHLPLDGHQELGNAAGIADLLDLQERRPFATMGEVMVGQRGYTEASLTIEELADTLERRLDTGDQPVRALHFGPEAISEVAIVTGSGADWIREATDVGADVLITGEGKQQAYHEARELDLSVVLAGHYATETLGLQALADHVNQWGIETTFLECPTGL